ncbi:helix-turn-helix transcriptional regulator [Halobacterium wangiae]|uniref:helix-turn-helix transcriptional regulator n=1 Tax=Halobacterium wangiae TaxID=2902623 RepID=UPI001E5FE673|nr:transcriptional regulator FilR1 domain-containing protein [Halobacterium wangiae]
MVSDTIHEFVARSAVRRAVLHAVADGGATTDDLLAAVEGSRSAVYKAVDALSEAGLVVHGDDDLATTGLGDVVAGRLADRERVARLLDGDGYWESHDASVLPTPFRRRLPALADAEVVESPDTYPTRARARAKSLLSSAERVDAFLTVRDPERADALTGRASGARTRVVLDESLSPADSGVSASEDGVSVRAGDAPCALCVTDDALLVQLPHLDGTFDDQSFLLARTDPALAWGRDYFEFGWQSATVPPEETAVSSR